MLPMLTGLQANTGKLTEESQQMDLLKLIGIDADTLAQPENGALQVGNPLLPMLTGVQANIKKLTEDAGKKKVLKAMQKLEQTAPNSGFYWKTNLEWMISHEERTDAIHSDGDLYQAYGVHEKIHQFDPTVRDIRFQIYYCLTLMLTNRKERANEVFDKIVSLVQNMGETFQTVLCLAEKTVKIEGKTFEAILLCLIAAKIADMSIFTVLDTAEKLKCMTVLREAAGKITDSMKKVKPFLSRYCVTAIRPLFEHIQQKPSSSVINKNLVQIRIATFHCMEILLLYADDDEGRAQLLEHALEFLRETYGDKVAQKRWYGIFNNNLGATYLTLSRPDKAAEALSRTIEVFQQATDFDNEIEREDSVFKAKQMLKQPSLGGLGVHD
uniref:Uncharacterized protein LOC100176565 n=1 Tax=Phallusia mammillata TaxID=59560 RepID=A0A6F9DFT3_9ASCI|nr:uncharacterized protein LOC100176565 [Phallusia mammillata]